MALAASFLRAAGEFHRYRHAACLIMRWRDLSADY